MKIIAEVGSNWKSKQDCEHSIRQAALAGAHAVKFQLFNPFELQGPAGDLNFEYGTSPYLKPDWLYGLKHCADANEIEFMITAFSVEGYLIIDQLVEVHKIASAELTDFQILDQVNKFKKPVILSTAGSDVTEVAEALLRLKQCPVTIMFCVADYPARIVDFRQLQRLKTSFGLNYSYGYSDHTIDVNNIPMIAKQMGCSVIEKHVNFTSHRDTPDAGHALNFEEFKLMSRLLMGEAVSFEDMADHCNRDMIRRHKRRFIVTKDIKAGDIMRLGHNVDIYRSTKVSNNPVLTFRQWDFEGKATNKDKIVGDTVSYQDIDMEII